MPLEHGDQLNSRGGISLRERIFANRTTGEIWFVDPPPGFVEIPAWYVPRRGAILRVFQVPTDERQQYAYVTDNRFYGRGQIQRFDDSQAAMTALDAYQQECLRDRNGTLVGVRWYEHVEGRCANDKTLAEWLRFRIREPGSPAWNLRALNEIRDYLEAHALADHVPDLVIETKPGADATSFAEACEQPLSPALRSLWSEIGGAFWRVGDRSMRFLAPDEVLGHRSAARELGAKRLDRVPAGEREGEHARPVLEKLDFLVVDQSGTAEVVMVDRDTGEGRAFATVRWSPDVFHWGSDLSSCLVETFLVELVGALLAIAPLDGLWYGQRLGPHIQTRRFEDHQRRRFVEIWHDEKLNVLTIRRGKRGKPGGTHTLRRRAERARGVRGRSTTSHAARPPRGVNAARTTSWLLCAARCLRGTERRRPCVALSPRTHPTRLPDRLDRIEWLRTNLCVVAPVSCHPRLNCGPSSFAGGGGCDHLGMDGRGNVCRLPNGTGSFYQKGKPYVGRHEAS